MMSKIKQKDMIVKLILVTIVCALFYSFHIYNKIT